MSPTTLRRYRAERLLRRDFEGLRDRVLASVRANLGARGIALDTADLEECYALAWQGMYTILLEGQQLDNPAGWLTTVCFRRAIDEHRQRWHEQQGIDGDPDAPQGHFEPDLAGAIDDRIKLRQTFEGLRQRLTKREQQAASLCYLQGLSRAQAAARIGISEARMRKLMEGRGPERPGVAAKVDQLLTTIAGGHWCEQQASLMRGLAYGVHDPDGERYRLAQLHRRECPACRAYVLSLRGLAAVLPPLALPWAPGMAGLGGALSGSGAVGLGGAAGGATAGGWLPLGGSLGVKLATGCLLVAGVGGGCVALIAGRTRHFSPSHATSRRHDLAGGPFGLPALGAATAAASQSTQGASLIRSATSTSAHSARSAQIAVAAGPAQRELGFERPSETSPHALAHSAQTTAHHARPPQDGGLESRPPPSSSPAGETPHTAAVPPRGAAAEFGPG
jgi:DNA-directed RNA polymerase specialized sigma24 family protein